jgi:hypothetical protein
MDQEPQHGRWRRLGALVVGTTMVLGGVVWGASAASATDTSPSPDTSTALKVCSATVSTDGTVQVSGDCTPANTTIAKLPDGGTLVTSGDAAVGTLVPVPAGKAPRIVMGKGTIRVGSGSAMMQSGASIKRGALTVVKGDGSFTITNSATTAAPVAGSTTK